MAISKYDKKFEYGKILTEGDLNGMVDAINLTIDGVNSADEKSETAIKEATSAKNAVKTLEGLANSTEAMETLAGQVVQIEENKSNIRELTISVIGNELRDLTDKIVKGKWIKSTGIDNGGSAWNEIRGYIEVGDIQGYSTIRFFSNTFGDNSVGSAFFDSSGNVLYFKSAAEKEFTLDIPSEAVVFRYSVNPKAYNGEVELSVADKSSTLSGVVERVTELEEGIGEEGMNLSNLPLGDRDNYLHDVIDSCGSIMNISNSTSPKTLGGSVIIRDSKMVGLQLSASFTTDASYNRNVVAVIKVKKSLNTSRCLRIRTVSGAESIFSQDTEEGTLLYQPGTQNHLGTVLSNDDTHITVFVCSWVSGTIFDSYIDNKKTDYEELIINRNLSGVFDGKYTAEDFNLNTCYLSRSEKLRSPIRGKNIVLFSDSLSAVGSALAFDWGANITMIAWGGARMGYVSGAGEGGETGSANSLWLCNNETITKFNDLRPEKVDYIVNCSGSNSTFSSVSTKEEVDFVVKNKRWWGDESSTNPWDSLSDQDKSRFTNEACYIASFYILTRLYPKATSVVCEVYRTPGTGNVSRDGDVWDSVESFTTALYNGNMIEKNEALKSLATKLGAVWVENNVRCGIVNAPYYIKDGVHPQFDGSTDWATSIATVLNFHKSIDEDLKNE